MQDLKFTKIIESNTSDQESNFDNEQQYLMSDSTSMNDFKYCIKSFQIKWRKYIIYTLAGFTLVLLIILIVIVINTNSSISDNKSSVKTFTWDSFKTTSSKGAIATDSKVCSDIGANILSRGGNSVDAAIASTLCLGVVSPISSGIGGGCYILIYNSSNKKSVFIDSRETAPKAAFETMFTNDSLAAKSGGLAIAVLGELKGLYLAFEKHGSGRLPWKDLVTPAAELAKRWVISPSLADTMKQESYDDLKSGKYPLLSELYLRANGKLKEAGDIVEQPILANTLKIIAEQGPKYIYNNMAQNIALEIQEAGGVITVNDIHTYQPAVYPALQSTVMGYTYLGAEGSSSGGPVVSGILKFMSSFSEPLISLGDLYYHRLAEAMKHTFAIRLFLGDPSFIDSKDPLSALLSNKYMGDLAILNSSDFDVQLLSSYGGKYNIKNLVKDDRGTTHISVIDTDGNAVSLTSTINTYFGSKVISKSTGILFNNQMDDFSIPNSPNFFGLEPSPLNFPEPLKRPLSSMSPTILLDKNYKVRLIGGASGGPRIITATAQVILNFITRGMNLLEAVVHPRIHSQLLPNVVDIESHTLTQFGLDNIIMPDDVYQSLVRRNQIVQYHDGSMGVAQFISIDPDTNEITAVSDPRKDGYPASQT